MYSRPLRNLGWFAQRPKNAFYHICKSARIGENRVTVVGNHVKLTIKSRVPLADENCTILPYLEAALSFRLDMAWMAGCTVIILPIPGPNSPYLQHTYSDLKGGRSGPPPRQAVGGRSNVQGLMFIFADVNIVKPMPASL